jgi:hypothetical protein
MEEYNRVPKAATWPNPLGERSEPVPILQGAILEALEAVGRVRNEHRQAEQFWRELTKRVSPVDAEEVAQELKGLFSNRRAA